MVRRSLILLGLAAAALILGFVALFSVGGGGNPTLAGGYPTTTTIAATRSAVSTSTTVVNLQGSVPPGINKREILVYVVEPNVTGITLAEAGEVLGASGLAYEISAPSGASAGTSSTGTILAQEPPAGSRVDQDQFIQLTVSGY